MARAFRANRLLAKYCNYEALSYTWGDPESTEPITCNGQIIHVTVNLERALRRIRLGISLPDNASELGTTDHQESVTSQDRGHTTSSLPSSSSESAPSSRARPYRPCLLWVDAISINQSEAVERNAQCDPCETYTAMQHGS